MNGRRTNGQVAPKGAALVELAIVLVLLVTIVLGCIDFGRFASTLIAVTNAAREGASYGSVHPVTPHTQDRWEAQIRMSVIDELSGLANFSIDDVTIPTPTRLADATDHRISERVRVEVTQEFHTIVPWPVFPRSMQITRAAEMPVVR